MNNLKPYIGRYLEKPIYLNLGQFGWYLNMIKNYMEFLNVFMKGLI